MFPPPALTRLPLINVTPESTSPRSWRFVVGVLFLFVFAAAIVVRLPTCYESFWLDELHSAWSVWGSLGEVMPRSAAGNQTPIYFWAMWLWKQMLGGSELSLRMPGVIATALAAAIVALGIIRNHGSVLAGAVAGLILAVDSNAIFYGTEFRPFAMVVLLGAVGCYVVSHRHWHDDRKLMGLVIVALAGGLIQPTSLGAFVWLIIVHVAIVKICRSRQTEAAPPHIVRSPKMLLLLLVSAAIFLWLAGDVLWHAWQHRRQWQGMGSADSLTQLWRAWPWLPLAIIPASVAIVAACCSRGEDLRGGDEQSWERSHLNNQTFPWWCFFLVAGLATASFWAAALLGIAPIFHRRYFVACLPILVWGTGAALAAALKSLEEKSPVGRRGLNWAVRLFTIVPLGLLVTQQGTFDRALQGKLPLVRRGEGWRELVRYLDDAVPKTTVIHLEPGLIEASRLLREEKKVAQPGVASEAQWYLTNPLRGPYAWPDVVAFYAGNVEKRVDFPIVYRGSRSAAQGWLRALAGRLDTDQVEIRSFGNVQWLEKASQRLPKSQY